MSQLAVVGVAEVVAVAAAAAAVGGGDDVVATRHAAAIADGDIDGVERRIAGMGLARMGSVEADIGIVEVVEVVEVVEAAEIVARAVVAVGNDALAAATGMLVGVRNEVVASVDMMSAEFEVAAAVGAAMNIATVEGIAVVVGIVPAALRDNAAPERYIALAVVASGTDYDEQGVATVLAIAIATAAAVVAAAGVVD